MFKLFYVSCTLVASNFCFPRTQHCSTALIFDVSVGKYRNLICLCRFKYSLMMPALCCAALSIIIRIFLPKCATSSFRYCRNVFEINSSLVLNSCLPLSVRAPKTITLRCFPLYTLYMRHPV